MPAAVDLMSVVVGNTSSKILRWGETMENVRVYEIPKCRMVSSECGMFGDAAIEEFSSWMETLPRTMFPRDFLWFDESRGGFVWYYMHHDGLAVPDGFDIVDFPGGLYAVASGIDGEDNAEAMNAIDRFIQVSGCFAPDPARRQLGNVITPPEAQKAMGYSQMDYYTPIKVI